MRWSDYLQVTEYDDSTILLFSTLTRSLIKIEKSKYNGFKATGIIHDFFSSHEIEFLKAKHFIIDNNLDEIKFVNVVLNADRLRPRVFSTYIALTTLCNFSCVYCYEHGQVNNYNFMSADTINAVIDWYRRIIITKHYTEFKVCLYGGEPLLYADLLKNFVDKITALAGELNIDLYLSMISNGYLFEGDLRDYLLDKGLKEVQITLDGCSEMHNRRRMLKSGEGTFDKIIDNIKKVLERDLKIVIRISFDVSNTQEIKNLLNFLAVEKLQNRIYIYFAPIHQTETQKINGCSFCSKNTYSDYNDIAEAYCNLYSIANDLKFKIPSCYTNGPCMVVGQDSCLIAPNGDLYKCVEMIGINELSIGSVRDLDYNSMYYEFMEGATLNDCIYSGCKYVPICGAGCFMESYLKGDNFTKASCHNVIFNRLTSLLNSLKFKNMENRQ